MPTICGASVRVRPKHARVTQKPILMVSAFLFAKIQKHKKALELWVEQWLWALGWMALAGLLSALAQAMDWLQDIIGSQLCGVLYFSGHTLALHNPWAEALYKTRMLVQERLYRLEHWPGHPSPVLDSWSKQTFPNVMQTVRYHLAKHGQGLSIYQYTVAALRHFVGNFNRARLKVDRAGQDSWNLRGDPGGWFTQAGQIITFWLPASLRGFFCFDVAVA